LHTRVTSDLRQEVVEFVRVTGFISPRTEIIFGFNNKQIYGILEIYVWNPTSQRFFSISVNSEQCWFCF